VTTSSVSRLEANVADQYDSQVVMTVTDGVDLGTARAAIEGRT
jgi:hypothetical protein